MVDTIQSQSPVYERSGLKIDLGCGQYKKQGTLGLDIYPYPGVDYVLDIEHQSLPFKDHSVAYVHSSHFLEHTGDPARVFAEISRVCQDGAHLELWTPYAWSNSGFVLGHNIFFTEDIYLHMCVWYLDYWQKILQSRWLLHELHYVIPPKTLAYLHKHHISLDFALNHLQNIATEFCAYITVQHDDLSAASPPVKRTFSTGRFEPRYEIKATEAFEGIESDLQKTILTFAKGPALPSPW